MTQTIDEIEDLRAELLFQSLHDPRVRVGRGICGLIGLLGFN